MTIKTFLLLATFLQCTHVSLCDEKEDHPRWIMHEGTNWTVNEDGNIPARHEWDCPTYEFDLTTCKHSIVLPWFGDIGPFQGIEYTNENRFSYMLKYASEISHAYLFTERINMDKCGAQGNDKRTCYDIYGKIDRFALKFMEMKQEQKYDGETSEELWKRIIGYFKLIQNTFDSDVKKWFKDILSLERTFAELPENKDEL
jgi:hypothetical protein